VGVVRYAGVEYEGRHEHLIDKTKAVLAAHNHAAEKDRKHHHYLKGSLFCGRCGSRMSLIQANGKGAAIHEELLIGLTGRYLNRQLTQLPSHRTPSPTRRP